MAKFLIALAILAVSMWLSELALLFPGRLSQGAINAVGAYTFQNQADLDAMSLGSGD